MPETRGDDLGAIPEDIAKAIGVKKSRSSNVAAHRIPSFNKRGPPTIVRQPTYGERDAWIARFDR